MGARTELPEWFSKSIIYHVTVGSELHGVTVPGDEHDDHDEMAVFIEPPYAILGLSEWDTFQTRTAWERTGTSLRTANQPRSTKGDTDFSAYSLNKYVRLLAKGNPSLIVPLFAPAEFIINQSETGILLVDTMREAVRTRATVKAFIGYMRAQREHLEGIRGSKVKRPELISKFGYDTKFAYHMLRLGIQGIELMTLEGVRLPMHDDHRKFLLSVREGEIQLSRVLEQANLYESVLEGFLHDVDLRPQMDTGAVDRFLAEMYTNEWQMRDIVR